MRIRYTVARHEGGDLHANAATGQEWIGSDEKGIGVLARKDGKGCIDLAASRSQ
jgi:hypothetical protein